MSTLCEICSFSFDNSENNICELANLFRDLSMMELFYLTVEPLTFKRQPHKMIKHTKTIRRQQPTNCLSLSDHFVELAVTHGPKYIAAFIRRS